MISLSFAEAISIAAIIPFVSIFLNPEKVYSHPLSSNFIEFFEITNTDELFLHITITFIFVIIISGLIKLYFLYFSNKISTFTEADFKSRMFKLNIDQSYSYHLKQGSNVVLSSLTQKMSSLFLVINSAVNIVGASLIIIFVLAILILFEPLLTLSISLFIIIFFVSVFFIKQEKILKNSKAISESKDTIVRVFQDSVGYIAEIILYSLQNIFISKFDKSSYQMAKSQTYIKNIEGSPRIYLEYITLLGLTILVFFIDKGKSELYGHLTILAALGLGAQKILPLINRIFSAWTNMRGHQFAIKDALDLLDLAKKVKIDKPVLEKIFFKKSIKLNNIYFSYDKSDKWILKNINLEIKKGSTIGIKGPTGCGKSTLGEIIIGLLNPTKGRLLVDDVLINNQNIIGWQKNISIIPQSTFLNDVSIAENIAIGVNPNEINLEKVKDSARQAQIADFIESIPNQYEEKVGERGIRLSGGQQQRIGIARALYREAKIILFDEATNQLDSDTESLVMQSINNLNEEITIIFIAHRLSTLKNCDHVVDFSKFEEK